MRKYIGIALLSLSLIVVADHDKALDCDNAFSTPELNQCAYIELEAAQTELTQYLQASFEHNAHDPELVEAIKVAQKDWQDYLKSHCDSVYTQWREGTIRGVMAISCKTTLTKQRTHEIWANFLTYIDSATPVLPEPKE